MPIFIISPLLYRLRNRKRIQKLNRLEFLYEVQKSIDYDYDYFTEFILWKFSSSSYSNKFGEMLNKCDFDQLDKLSHERVRLLKEEVMKKKICKTGNKYIDEFKKSFIKYIYVCAKYDKVTVEDYYDLRVIRPIEYLTDEFQKFATSWMEDYGQK